METEPDTWALPSDHGGIATLPLPPPATSAPIMRWGGVRDAVVVGVDNSLGVLTAVSWAAVEAMHRGVDLHLLHVERDDRPDSVDPRRWLHRALGTATAVAPGLGITVIREHGAIGPVLARYTRRASLLVVGGRRLADGGPSAGRTVAEALRRADCPVVVVPPRRTGSWASTPSSRPVVVGLMAHDDGGVLDLAAAVAARRAAPLLVVAEGGAALPRADAADRRETWLAPAQDLVAALRVAGRRAQLVVLEQRRGPTRRHPDIEDFLARTPCPVMVVTEGRSPRELPGPTPRLVTTFPASHGGTPHDHEQAGLAEPAGM